MHLVGHAVRGQAQVLGQHDLALAQQLLVAHRVPEPEAHVEAAVGQARHRTADHGIGAAAAPLREVDIAAFVQRLVGRQGAEQAAAFEVGAHDGGQAHAAGRFAAEVAHHHRHLGGADAGDLDPELGRGGRSRCSPQSPEDTEELAPRHGTKRRGGVGRRGHR